MNDHELIQIVVHSLMLLTQIAKIVLHVIRRKFPSQK
ncbi:Uncharacterised protein [Serratia liquefaciens]|nr:Uncharacterised protein [Serratia liquefaciens]